MEFLLIGGRDVDSKGTNILDFIVNYKNNPNILFVPAASLDSTKSINNLCELFKNYKCNYDFLLLYKNPSDIKEKISWADIIYFSGGNTQNLVSKVIEYNIIKYAKNKLLVGISAGMNMMAKYGVGDAYSYEDNFHTYNYKMVEGIGLINYIVCPHYNMGDRYIFNDFPAYYDISGLALENDTALYIKDDCFYVIKDNNKRSIYSFLKGDNFKMESLYNKKIAVLGPKGTYCDMACDKYLKNNNLNYEKVYCKSIKKTIEEINNTGLAVVPFENSLDGYVLETIDALILNNYKIISDLDLKVELAFVSNAKRIEDIKTVYVQFKAKAECIDFLTIQNNFNLIITESNMESLNKLLDKDESYAAIIPMHKAREYNFNICKTNIMDSDTNYTRFVAVTKKDDTNLGDDIKCSLCIFMNEDYPGILFDALKLFNLYKINLNAIISRPTKEALGKYNFYIEISSKKDHLNDICKCIDELNMDQRYEIKNLGIYSK